MAGRQIIESRIEGLEAARGALEAIIRAQRGAVGGTLEVIGQAWVGQIQRHAPLLTGRLRRSYTWEVGSSAGFTYVEVSSNVHYAPYQEFGTRYIDGTPHVRPAAEVIIRQGPELLRTGLARAAAAAGGSGAGRIGSTAARLGALGD